MTTSSNIFNDQNADLIEKAVIKYKLNHQHQSDIIIELLNPLILKYIKILTSNNINFKDRTSYIVALGLTKSAKSKGPLSNSDKIRVSQLFWGFCENLFKNYSTEDIYNELVVLILEMVKEYEQKGSSFCAYVATSLPYKFVTRLRELTSDTITINDPIENISIDELFYLSSDESDDDFTEVINPAESTEDVLDKFWVFGETAKIFKDLVPFERKLLMLKYPEINTNIPFIEQAIVSDHKIAEITGYSRQTIIRKRRSIESKLANKLETLKEHINQAKKTSNI